MDDLAVVLSSKHRPRCIIEFISQSLHLLDMEAAKRQILVNPFFFKKQLEISCKSSRFYSLDSFNSFHPQCVLIVHFYCVIETAYPECRMLVACIRIHKHELRAKSQELKHILFIISKIQKFP